MNDAESGGFLNIAVEGCCHGELDNIYKSIQFIQEGKGVKIDLLLICGDFQAVRNAPGNISPKFL